MMQLIKDLWLKRRDLVSDGYDESLEYIARIIPLKIHNISTGTKCWTWTVPEKWQVKEAFVEDLEGQRILDLKDHPLRIMSYSLPVNKIVSREELFDHLHTNMERPNSIPFEFKYYERDWGFCLAHNKLKDFTKDKYKVFINSEFTKGNLRVGEYTIPGKNPETVVLMAHLCHPAQANDDLAGVTVLVDLAKDLSQKNNNYTYKILIVPETIGSIAYLSQNEKIIPKLKYGVFLEMLGNNNDHVLQLSRQGDTRLDRIAEYVLEKSSTSFRKGTFRKIVKNDEGVFNGPGVDMPMISISRFPYPEYHTSDDNLSIISEARLNESKNIILKILDILDKDYIPKRNFKGPVFLSGYGLWVNKRNNPRLNDNIEQIMFNFEGQKSVFDIARDLNMEFEEVLSWVDKFLDKRLIVK